jgi:ribosomal protein S18 acetylase RimI-like enzyme
MKILNWTIESFSILKNLLDQSAGYLVSIEDEIEYFNRITATSWHYAVDKNERPIGFIRLFRQSGGFCPGEFYVPLDTENREVVINSLLTNFLERFNFQLKDRVRFAISMSDLASISILKSAGFTSRIEEYHYYEKIIIESKNNNGILVTPSLEHFEKTKKTLLQIHDFSDEEIKEAIKEKRILALVSNEIFSVISRFGRSDDKAEIIEIVTDKDYRNQGLGLNFLNLMTDHFSILGIKSIYLFVKEDNKAAIRLYEKANFIKNNKKSQIWLSKE